MWFFFPVLKANSNLRLGREPSDINFQIRVAQALKSLQLPWNRQDWINFPLREHFWVSSADLTNLGLTIPIFVLTRVVDAALAINVYSMCGIYLSGLAIFLLARELEVDSFHALVFGVVGQALPWLRFNATFGVGTTYYLALPIISIILLIRIQKSWSIRRTMWLICYLFVLSLTNPYLFFFSLFAVLITVILNGRALLQAFRKKRHQFQILSTISAIVVIACSVSTFNWLLSKTVSETGSPFGVYSLREVQSDHLSFGAFLTPTYDHLLFPSAHTSTGGWTPGDVPKYVGILILVLAVSTVFRLFPQFLKSNQRSKPTSIAWIVRYLVVLSVMLFWLGMKNVALPGGLELPAANSFMRFVMPGIRKMVRTGLPIQGILVGLAAVASQRLTAVVSRRLTRIRAKNGVKYALCLLLGIACIADLNPTSYRFVNRDPLELSVVNKTVRGHPTIDLRGPNSLINNDYVLAPMWTNFPSVLQSAFFGSQDLANFLYANGVRFAIASPTSDGEAEMMFAYQDIGRAHMRLDRRFFIPVTEPTTFVKNSDTESLRQDYVLLKIVDQELPTREPLPVPAQIYFDPPLAVDDPLLPRSATPVNWFTSSLTNITFESLFDGADFAEPQIEFSAEVFVPNKELDLREFVLIRNGQQIPAESVFENGNLKFTSNLSDSIQIRYLGDCLPSRSIGQLLNVPICFGMKKFFVIESSKQVK